MRKEKTPFAHFLFRPAPAGIVTLPSMLPLSSILYHTSVLVLYRSHLLALPVYIETSAHMFGLFEHFAWKEKMLREPLDKIPRTTRRNQQRKKTLYCIYPENVDNADKPDGYVFGSFKFFAVMLAR